MVDIARPRHPSVIALTALSAALLALAAAATHLPVSIWPTATLSPDSSDIAQMLFLYSHLPRLAVALVAGAMLGLAGAILQQVLQNPLASPSTLGVSAGAQLALALALLFAPGLIGISRVAVAMGGGSIAVIFVMALSWRSRLAPVTVLLAGVVVALIAGTIAAALVLFNEQAVGGLFIWGSGSLVQDGWSASGQLLPGLLAALAAITVIRRPLALLSLDEGARNLGLSVGATRLAGMAIAIVLTGLVVANVGVIGFVGLAAPALARTLGIRHPIAVLLWSTLIGALMLSITDSGLQLLSQASGITLPTGAVTALIGAPVLLVLIPAMRSIAPPSSTGRSVSRRLRQPLPLLGVLALGWIVLVVVSLTFGRLPDGSFGIPDATMLSSLLSWRWPRILASVTAGAMLASAGLILQRLTRNPAASPELLGVSSGAAAGLVAAIFLSAAPGYWVQLGSTAAGAFALSACLLLMTSRGRLSSDQLLLTGIALGTLVGALLAMAMASGDPRMLLVANWLAGSTYDAEPETAIFLGLSMPVLLAACVTVIRWLELMPLGSVVARQVGVPVSRATFLLLALSSLLTAAATLAIGPVSFIGLLAPHLAQRLGLTRAGPHLAGTALLGGLVLILADWIGRNAYFPFQIPAGLVSALIGSPALIWLLWKRR